MAVREVEDIFIDIIDRTKTIDPANARKWFDRLTVSHLDGGSLGIGCPDEATVQFLQDNCKSSFTRAAQQITGHLIAVDFGVDTHEKPDSSSRRFESGSDGPILQKKHGSTEFAEVKIAPPKLHPDYTFDNFVVGPSNRLAHASCVAVSQSPGNTYNPLFIYGNSGLGKTHLLHAVCFEAQRKSNGAVIQYLSCEEFVNRFIRAIEEGNLSGFQSQFRTVDMLVIDDVQFLREREHSQEEFFHTFNALYNNGKQIILSADSPPGKIPSLEERLISRFNWGLVTRIDPPSYETRVAIVQKKAHLRGLNISDEIAEYIARKLHANIRELEGALTTIYAVATTTDKVIDLELAQIALEGQIKAAARHISITDIIEVVTSHFDVRLADLQSKKRSQSITEPRQICMYLARNLTKHSLEEIGGHLGGRDHTTVMHACSKISQAEKSDPQMHTLLGELTKQITQTPKA
ncbi:MAG: chromosomal replication initiator protein DnaA [Planctomycetes bacterium]|nr:chromosomal replication initiator protein DnaA [Planctomycetota bacterium]MCH8119545.1 chromosomal replication initiator protein DnaA [Planctomycetota bacterium]